ncbi:MAG: vWA domain-containing protein, partial [Myxococcota bacterium]|nr:vWA domain-containing protein [Myxococcota bacterium]
FFSKKLVVKQEFTNNISDIKKAINSLLTDTSGVNTTNLYGALIEAISTNEQAQQQRQSAMQGGTVTFGQVVVFTDGSDQAALNTLGEASAAVQNTRDDVVMISFGGEVSENVLAQLGKNGAYGATEASDLAGLFQVVAEVLRSRKQALYVLGYCTPKLAGEHELTLAIEGKGVSVPIDFSAAGFAADGDVCSTSAFGSACSAKGCGGLWCGGCASLSATCNNTGQCSDGTNGAGGTGTWGAECTADDDCPAPFICQLPKDLIGSGGQCTQICPNGNIDCTHADWICMAAQLPGVDSCEPSSGFFGSGAIISPFCGPPEAIENSEFSMFEYFPCP